MRERGNLGRLIILIALVGAVSWLIARGQGGETVPEPEPGDAMPAKVPELEPAAPRPAPALPPPSEQAEPRGAGRIDGVVIGADDQPVVGVTVVVRRRLRAFSLDPFDRLTQPAHKGEELRRVVTDERGRFALDGIVIERGWPTSTQLSSYTLEAVVAAPLISTSVQISNWGRVAHRTVLLRVLSGAPLRLRVIDPSDQPVRAVVRARAEAEQIGPGLSPRWRFGPRSTDADGRLRIAAAPRATLWFDVLMPGRLAVTGMRALPPAEGELVLRVGGEQAGAISGNVADSNEAPVEGAQVLVTIRPVGPGSGRYVLQATTDAEGAFVFQGVVPGVVERVSARAPGLVGRTWRNLGRTVAPGATTHLGLTLFEGAVLQGVVRDEQGVAVVGARVVVLGGGPGRQQIEGVSDEQGRYTVRGLRPGTFQLYVAARGYFDEHGPKVTTRGGGVIAGWRTVSRVGDKKSESYTLVVEAAGQVIERDFRVKRGLATSGIVLDASGHPVPRAKVGWRHYEKRRGGRQRPPRSDEVGALRDFPHIAETDADGRFEHPGLGPPNGWWLVVAHTESACSEPQLVSSFDTPVELTLRLQAQGAIRGRVMDRAGAPVPRVSLRLDLKGAGTVGLALSGVTLSGHDGSFAFEGLTVGRYEVRAVARVGRRWKTLGSRGAITLTPGQEIEDLEIEVVVPEVGRESQQTPRPAASVKQRLVEGTVLAPDGSPVDAARIGIRVEGGRMTGAAILRGRFGARVALTATRLTFTVSDARDSSGRLIAHAPFALSDQPADSGPFMLQLRAGQPVAGRVEDDEGNGIADVHLSIGGGGRGPRALRTGKSTRTDPEGNFRFEGLAEGSHKIRVELSQEYIGSREVFASAGEEDVRISFTRGAVIAGQVFGPDGEPIEGVEMAAMPADRSTQRWVNAVSDKEGLFRFVGLTQDAVYTVRARPWARDVGRADLLHAYVRDVRPGREDVEVHLQVGVHLEGQLLLPDGTPAGGHSVAGFEEGQEGGARSVKTDAEGRFRIGPFGPGTLVSLSGYPRVRTHDAVSLRGIRVPASRLTLRLKTSRVRYGRVAGEGLRGFQWAWNTASGHRGFKGPVEEDGSIVINRLPEEGKVTVFVYGRADDRYALATDVLVSGDEDEVVQLELLEGVGIKGTIDETIRKDLRHITTIRAESVAHGFFKHAYMQGDGSFHIRGIPAGRYLLRVMNQEHKEVATTEVEAGTDDVVVR